MYQLLLPYDTYGHTCRNDELRPYTPIWKYHVHMTYSPMYRIRHEMPQMSLHMRRSANMSHVSHIWHICMLPHGPYCCRGMSSSIIRHIDVSWHPPDMPHTWHMHVYRSAYWYACTSTTYRQYDDIDALASSWTMPPTSMTYGHHVSSFRGPYLTEMAQNDPSESHKSSKCIESEWRRKRSNSKFDS